MPSASAPHLEEINLLWEQGVHLLGDNASNPAVVSWMLSPAQVVHSPITIASIVFFVLGFVTLMGASQGDSLAGVSRRRLGGKDKRPGGVGRVWRTHSGGL